MRLLPHWALTDKHPAFYDTESGSAIEQTAKVYAAMQELIKEYNSFVDEINKGISDFEAATVKDAESFKACITATVEKYIKSIDIMIDKQDLKIDNAIEYMKDNIISTTTAIVQAAVDEGKITVISNYNPESESLDMLVTGGV